MQSRAAFLCLLRAWFSDLEQRHGRLPAAWSNLTQTRVEADLWLIRRFRCGRKCPPAPTQRAITLGGCGSSENEPPLPANGRMGKTRPPLALDQFLLALEHSEICGKMLAFSPIPALLRRFFNAMDLQIRTQAFKAPACSRHETFRRGLGKLKAGTMHQRKCRATKRPSKALCRMLPQAYCMRSFHAAMQAVKSCTD